MKNKYESQGRALLFSTFCLMLIPFFTDALITHDVLHTHVPGHMIVQQTEVSGTITDAYGNPLAGIHVMVKASKKGVVSNFDGTYTVIANSNDTLIVSGLGFVTQTIMINNQTQMNILLKEDVTKLATVTINAGYYTVKDKERTGNISRITAKDIEKQPVSNPLEALQGRLSGVEIAQNSGTPGGGFEVKIRGQNSILAGNEPLYVIDGVPYDVSSIGNDYTSGSIIPSGNISPLNSINPNTITSIEVLKDADATAIYGSRGANGVVLITTKKGKHGKTTFDLSSSTGIAQTTKRIKLLNTQQYLNMRQEAYTNDGITDYPANAHDINGTWDMDRYTDWQEILMGNNALIKSLQATVSGGNENTRYLLGGMLNSETTVFSEKFKYQRLNVNANLNHRSDDKRFALNFNITYSLENNKLPGRDLSYNTTRLAPNAPALYDTNGNLNWENSTWTNPLAELNGNYNNHIKTLRSNSVISYKFFGGFSAKVNLGYGHSGLNDFRTYPHTIYNPAFGRTSSTSRINKNASTKTSWIVEPQLNWKKTFNNSRFDVLLGTTFQMQEKEQLAFLAFGFADNRFINNLSAANTLLIRNEDKTQYKYQSVFGRINYAYRDKIYINFTGRRDGSSRFGSGNKYGNFGALGAAWIFSEDLQKDWLSLGKLRASYGITGNDQISDYQYLQTYTINTSNNYNGSIGLDPTRIYNPNFQWEQNKKIEVALELELFDNKIGTTLAHYNNRSSNQLIGYALPGTTGFTSIQANLDALVENSGWELDINAIPIQINALKWQVGMNVTVPKNKLLKFPNIDNTPYANQYVIGKALSITKLYRLKGVNAQTGLFEFEDYNNDGRITSQEDREYIADLNPKFYGGFSNTLNYKNWELNVFFQFVEKDGFNRFYNSDIAGTLVNQPIEVLDRWQQPGDQASMQRYTSGADAQAYNAYSQFSLSNGVISDASFIRLKTMALSYTIPFKKGKSSTCRLYLQGQNLLTFTRFKNGDPEQLSRFFLPPLRRVTLGAQFIF